MPSDNVPVIPTLDIEQIKANISEYSSEKLCEMIVCDRYFGWEQQVSAICMEELAKRRMAGDTLDFETHIDKAFKSLPSLKFVMPDFRTLLSQAARNKIRSKL
jgi:hypothetical protein